MQVVEIARHLYIRGWVRHECRGQERLLRLLLGPVFWCLMDGLGGESDDVFGAPTVSACPEGKGRVGGGAEGGEEGAQAREGFAEGYEEEEGEHGVGDLEEVVAGQLGKQAVQVLGILFR